jgi:hypothetical protein
MPEGPILPPSEPLKKSGIRNPLILSTIIAATIALYVAGTFFTRWESNRTIEKRNAVKAAEQQRSNDQAAVDQMGGSELAIRALYLSPAAIYTGEKSQLCYDVANAKTVTVDPPIGEVWPSHTRCLDVSPTKSTTYTLTIADAQGHTASQTVELQVSERPPVHVKSFPSK